MQPDLKSISVPMSSGTTFHPFAPRKSEINLNDIARGLARQCRYAGQTSRFYSVAEHSLILARYFQHKGAPARVCLAALLHDAAEAYIGDIRRPIKALFPELEQYENVLIDLIFQVLGLEITADEWQMILDADTDIIYNEFFSLFPNIPEWSFHSMGLVLATPIKCMNPEWAEREFLSMARAWMREMEKDRGAA